MDLSTLTTILLDGDGVLWRANEAVPGLNHFFDVLHEKKLNWALLTNNNTRTVQDYIDKLAGFGITAQRDQIFTSSVASADYVIERFGPGAPVHAVGMKGVIETLQDAGLNVTYGEEFPDHPVVAVVAGMDREVTHAKIRVAMRLIRGGALFIATNTDPTFPTPEGLDPGTGMIIGALKGTTSQEPVVMGKPERAIFEAALHHFGSDPAATAMVGDRLDTDILGAQQVGMRTIAVLTGVATRESLLTSTIKPDLVFDSIAELAAALEPVKTL